MYLATYKGLAHWHTGTLAHGTRAGRLVTGLGGCEQAGELGDWAGRVGNQLMVSDWAFTPSTLSS